MSDTTTAAYRAGYADGTAWDLDGFDSWDDVRTSRDGWDEATINALGTEAFLARCAPHTGAEGPEWSAVCAEYNRGAYDGALSDDHSGLKPGHHERESKRLADAMDAR